MQIVILIHVHDVILVLNNKITSCLVLKTIVPIVSWSLHQLFLVLVLHHTVFLHKHDIVEFIWRDQILSRNVPFSLQRIGM